MQRLLIYQRMNLIHPWFSKQYLWSDFCKTLSVWTQTQNNFSRNSDSVFLFDAVNLDWCLWIWLALFFNTIARCEDLQSIRWLLGTHNLMLPHLAMSKYYENNNRRNLCAINQAPHQRRIFVVIRYGMWQHDQFINRIEYSFASTKVICTTRNEHMNEIKIKWISSNFLLSNTLINENFSSGIAFSWINLQHSLSMFNIFLNTCSWLGQHRLPGSSLRVSFKWNINWSMLEFW